MESELRDMIEEAYIQLEGGILGHEDNKYCDYDGEFRQVKESVSSNVNKALLEENLELQGEISRLLREMSYLEVYNKQTNERCESLEEALSEARA